MGVKSLGSFWPETACGVKMIAPRHSMILIG
jgi:hypothetical protein